MKVLTEHYDAHSFTLLLSAPPATRQSLSLRVNAAQLHPRSEDVELLPIVDGKAALTIAFSAGPADADGYVQKTVTIRW